MVVVHGVVVKVVHVIGVCLLVQEIQSTEVESCHGFGVSDDVLEVARVSHDDVLALVQLNDELVEFDEVATVVIQLELVVDAWAEEDADDTVLELVGLNIDGDSELLGVHATSAANNVVLPCVQV